MTQVFVDLALPNGSDIPAGLTLEIGNPTFDGSGLLGDFGTETQLNMDDLASDGLISSYVRGENGSTAYFVQKFRYQDDDNHYRVQWRFKDKLCRFIKVVNGEANELPSKTLPNTVNSTGSYGCNIELDGNSIEVFIMVGGVKTTIFSVTDSDFQNAAGGKLAIWGGLYTIRTTYFENTEGVSFDLPPLNYPQYIQGFKRKVTKLGKILEQHTAIPTGKLEYWFRPYLTENFPNWPRVQYPAVAYSSTDHDTQTGGVTLRVYEEIGAYDLSDENSWHEWQDISGRPEFDHITKKSGIIFFDDSNGAQTETPTIYVKDAGTGNPDDNTLLMYYHNDEVTIPNVNYGAIQTTKRVSGTNPVDFGGISIVHPYSPEDEIGNGHNGYHQGGLNTFRNIDAEYIARVLHSTTKQIKVSDDLENWTTHLISQANKGLLAEFNEFAGKVLNDQKVWDAIPEGPYYRIWGAMTLPVGGVSIQASEPYEYLIDGEFNLVSIPKILVSQGAEGEFDSLEVAGFSEITYADKTHAFYVCEQPSGTTGVGVVLVESEETDWEIITTYADKNSLYSTTSDGVSVAPNLTYSHTPSLAHRNYEYVDVTSVPLPMDTTVSTVIADTTFNLLDHDYIDIHFRKIGKNSSKPIELEFGITDDVNNPSEALAYYWVSSSKDEVPRAEPAQLLSIIGSVSQLREGSFEIGQSDNWRARGREEAPTALMDIGFRIIPSENKLIMLEGVGQTTVYDIEGIDYSKDFKIYIKANVDVVQDSDASISFKGIDVFTYTDSAIAVPTAPTLTTAKTADSITLTAGSVAGATGYKYFLDGKEQDNGVFTGLEAETEYTVYARASNALGDSAPSEISTVTTTSATPTNTKPVISSFTGPQTASAGSLSEYVVTATDPENDNLSYGFTVDSTGPAVTLNTNTNECSFTAVQNASEYSVTITARVYDGELYSDPVSITNVVEAYVPPVQNTESELSVRIDNANGTYLTSVMDLESRTFLFFGNKTWTDGAANFVLQNADIDTYCEVVIRAINGIERGMSEGVTE